MNSQNRRFTLVSVVKECCKSGLGGLNNGKVLSKCGQKIRLFFSTALFSAFSFAQGKLAIVIDDIGYHPKEDAEILVMPKEISVAIIPAAPYAKIRNQQAKAQNHDILIHMPMQPVSNIKIEEGGLTLGLSEAQVNERVKKAKSIVPNAIGMNNHMGSAATADTTLMTYLMSALREQHLFFFR